MKKIIWGTIITLILLSDYTIAQDLTFSQFYEKPLLRNPGLAGVFDGDIRISGVHRDQWRAVTVPYQTSAVSAEVKFPINRANDWVTLGLQATYDVAGDIKLKRTQLLPVLNYHKSLSGNTDDYLSLAFMAGPVNSQFDPTQLKLDDQYQNGSFNPNNSTSQVFQRTGFSYWDASTGITYSSGFAENSRFYIGGALFHFNKPKVAFYTSNSNVRLTPKWVVNAGLSMPTGEMNRIILGADYFIQGGNRQFLGGGLYGIDFGENYETGQNMTLYMGGFYRWNDAFVPVVKLDLYSLSFGLSYDVNVSKLKTASQWRGGFELTAIYRAKLNRRSGDESVLCPH